MDTFSAIEQRRSVKKYDPQHVMSEDEERRLLELTLLSPTAFNIQHWRFVCVRNQDLKNRICEAAWNQEQVRDCSLLVILAADKLAWQKEPQRYWRHAPEPVAGMLVPMILEYYDGREQEQRDEVMRSCGLAGQTLMLAAKAMGYDTCPMDGFDFAKVGELINLPADHLISFMVTVGKAREPAYGRPGQLPYEEVVIRDRFA